MELYFGGFAQGKLAYVKAKYEKDRPARTVIECSAEDYKEQLESSPENAIIHDIHIWVRDILEAGDNPQAVVLDFVGKHRDCIIICDEIGSGIIPIEKKDRIWREETGRLLAALAGEAESVERIMCGLSMKLK